MLPIYRRTAQNCHLLLYQKHRRQSIIRDGGHHKIWAGDTSNFVPSPQTRLSSNLRPTTRECVHLVTRGHFRSRDKRGGHTIRSAISENLMLHANLIALSVIEPELGSIEVLYCGNRDFRPFLLL